MEQFPEDSYYLQCMKTILDAYPQHSPPLHPTRLTDQLYIGNQDNADDVSLLNNLGVTHVLNCAGTRNFDLTRSPYPPKSGIKEFLMIPAQDYDEFNIMQYFESAIGFLDSAVLNGGKAFVHCSIGVNRSGAIVAAYLMISLKKRLMDVIVELKAKRLLILCNMGFRKQLVQFARANGLLDRVDMSGPKPRQFQLYAKPEPSPEIQEKSDEAENIEKKNGVHGEEITNGGDADESHQSNGVEIKEKQDEEETKDEKCEYDGKKPSYVPEKKYVYRTRAFAPETTHKHPVSGTTKSYKNVDSDIVLKLLNESYGKYKESSKLKDYKTPVEIKNSVASTLTVLPHQHKSLSKRSAEKELAREVEDFLTSSKSITGMRSDVDSLLTRIISKEDERLIWGKGDLEKDPEYLLFRNNLDKPKSTLQPSELSQAKVSADISSKTKSLEHLLKKYNDTTSKEIFKDLQSLADNPSKKFGTPELFSGRSKEIKQNQALDNEVSDYLKTQKHLLPVSSKPAKDVTPDPLKRFTSANSPTNIKPISYYRLQVLNEKKSKDPELQQATNDYLSLANGHKNVFNKYVGADKQI